MTPNSMPPVDLAVTFAADVCRRNGLDPWAEAAGLGRRNIETIAVPRLAASRAMAHSGRS
jgi:hypothetical protein